MGIVMLIFACSANSCKRNKIKNNSESYQIGRDFNYISIVLLESFSEGSLIPSNTDWSSYELLYIKNGEILLEWEDADFVLNYTQKDGDKYFYDSDGKLHKNTRISRKKYAKSGIIEIKDGVMCYREGNE